MVIGSAFQNQSKALANYDYTDLASGTGYVTYYAFNSINNSTVDYHINSNVFFSDNPISNAQYFANGTAVTVLDLDFDLSPFKVPQYMEGEAIINIPTAISTNNNYNSSNVYFTVNIIHYDGSTETNIGTARTENYSTTPGGANDQDGGLSLLAITVTPKLFKEGDILRINVTCTATLTGYSGGSTAEFLIGTDPANRSTTLNFQTGGYTFDVDSAIFKVDIPYRIDI